MILALSAARMSVASLLADRPAIQIEFAGDFTVGPALLVQGDDGLLCLHFEFVH